MAGLTSLGAAIGILGPRLSAAPKRADTLYASPEWRALMRAVKADRGAWCERCGSSHRVAGDHKVEVKDGGSLFDPVNIELLCQACHNRKTAAARAARAGLASRPDAIRSR